MNSTLDKSLEYARTNQPAFLDNLNQFLRIPSISTGTEHSGDVRRAADFLAARLRDIGMNNVNVCPTGKHPVVSGEWTGAPGAPTVLIYGHYDVQPADPLDLWTTPPFDPVERGENLYARGASDMKGQITASVNAVESIMRSGGMPVNVKWVLEGEEEIGSPSLEKFLVDNRSLLKADCALNPDAGMISPDHPTITYGLRGLAYYELRIQGPAGDLHSGLFGGAVHNPAVVLSELIAGMHDRDGRVTLKGFYDRVIPLSDEERAGLARLPMDDAFYLAQTGAPALWGEKGYTPTERIGARPTLEINGMLSGFTAPGSKTVLPSKAMAKISTRLVPNQDPAQVTAQLRGYLQENMPGDVTWELVEMQGCPAAITDRKSPAIAAMSQAMEETWGVQPFMRRDGGSIPVVEQLQRLLRVDSVLTGFGLPDDCIHAPNEKLHLPTWHKGTEAIIRFLFGLARNR